MRARCNMHDNGCKLTNVAISLYTFICSVNNVLINCARRKHAQIRSLIGKKWLYST